MNFGEKISEIMKDRYYNMHQDTVSKLVNTVQKSIADRINPDGSFNGEQFKIIENRLNEQISHFKGSNSADDRMFSNALNDIKGLLKDQLSSTSPEGAAALQQINKGYSIFKIAQKATDSTNAPSGVFSPAQLHGAVRAADKTKDNRAFTEGAALLQDLSSAAKNVLSPYKDSGTAGRGLAAAAAGSVATGGLSTLIAHPIGTAAGIATAGMYTKPGQALARAAMTKRPPGASALSELVRRATDVSALSPYAQ